MTSVRLGSKLALAITVGLSLHVPAAARAQSAPLELSRLRSGIAVDGTMNDAAWTSIAPLPMTMYTPVFNGTPTQRTEVRVAYDDEFLYVGGWFFDTEPDKIRINSLYRDRWNGDDAVAIYIDTFNDNQNSKWFGTTPSGMRFDLLLSADGATTNESWDSFWTSRATITSEGWFVEVQIPFSTLGFRTDADGRTVMGLTITRLVSRLNERVTFPAIDPKFDFRRPSLGQEVVLRDVKSPTPVYVTPYVLSGVSRKAEAVATSGFRDVTTTNADVGLDIRYPLSGNLTLDVTANTDFAQVEADDQQVNLDRFPLFFPERRRFFQEGSGVFDFAMGQNSRLFNSRRIGLTATGTPVPVTGGARLVGRVGRWDLGALAMRTGDEGAGPAENFGVLRLRRPVLNQFSTAGLMLTAFDGAARTNIAAGVDGSFRVLGDEFITVKAASTVDDAQADDSDLTSRSIVDFDWQRRRQQGLQYGLTYTRAGADYRPELGFQPRRDFTSANGYFNYYILTDKHPILRRIYPGGLIFNTFRNADRVVESGSYAFWLQWDTKRGGGGWVEPKWFRENVATAFNIGPDITIPAGEYDFLDYQLVLTMAQGSRLRANLDARAGTYFDGRRQQVIVRPTWNASRHFELGADYQLTRLTFPSRDQADDISVLRLRVRTALDVKLSGNAFVQYNSASDGLDFNVRLRYAIAEGTDLWLVYNEGLDTDRGPDGSGGLTPFSLARSVILKYTHTFAR